MQPGNLQGGFNWYRSVAGARLATIKETAPALPPITLPTCVRWGDGDPLLPVQWADRLGETFTDLDFAPMPGVGHFPHREDPPRAAAAIKGFFSTLAEERWKSTARA